MKKNKIVSWVIQGMSIALISSALIVGNMLTNEYELAITTELCPEIVDEEVRDQSSVSGQEMSSLVMEEGAVLLKNDNVLPLSKEKDKKVNVFGWSSVEWVYSATGSSSSGCVRPEDGDASKNVDFLKALEMYGIEYNKQLQDMYRSYYAPRDFASSPTSGYVGDHAVLKEPSISDKKYYTDDLLSTAKNYSDTAFVVFSRISGENYNCPDTYQPKAGEGASNDNTRHFLEITTQEEELLRYVGANYEKVIVILNTGNQLECGFLDTIPGIDACMFVGYTGTRAANVIPKLLYGEASPSGHLVDTYAYDMFTNPANIFTNPLKYTNYAGDNLTKGNKKYNTTYVDMIENIYVGYMWYETADTMGYWNDYESQYGKGYDGVVQFPFGHGLSYSTFDWEVTSLSIEPGSSFTDKDKIKIDITVTNTGDVAAKDSIQLYATAPYYANQIEKSSVVLIDFVKSHEIEPGKNEKLTVEIDPYDFSSYDCYDKNNNNHKGYELDAGEYTFSLRTNSHDVKTIKYDSKDVLGEFKFNIDKTINIDEDPVTGKKVGNLFTGEDALDGAPIDAGDDSGIEWLTRADFKTLEEIKAMYTSRAATEVSKYTPLSEAYRLSKANEWDTATVDIFGDPVKNSETKWNQKHGLSLTTNNVLTDLGKKLGESYEDPEWDRLLEQLSPEEVYTLVNNYYGTKKIDSIGKIALTDYDGPAQVKGFRNAPRGVGFPCMTLTASTWNPRLAYDYGKAFGDSAVGVSVNGVWGWAMDNHRSSFFGRANESPSEDPVLSGKMIAKAVKGFNTRGRYCFLKHFSFYVTGWNHNYIEKGATCVFNTEQGVRETTLKAYRYAIVEGGALGVMTSYEGFGAEHSETSEALLTGVLRKEWDFKGAITSDYVSYPSKAAVCEGFVRAGGNLGMNMALSATTSSFNSLGSNRFQNRLKDVAKEILWTWLRAEYNARYYQANPDTDDQVVSSTSLRSWVWWKPLLSSVNLTAGVGLTLWLEAILLNIFWPEKNSLAKRKEESVEEGGN